MQGPVLGSFPGHAAGPTHRTSCSEAVRTRSGRACWSTQSPAVGRLHPLGAARGDPERLWALAVGQKGLHRAESLNPSDKGMRGFKVPTQSPFGPHASRAPIVTSKHRQRNALLLVGIHVCMCSFIKLIN